MRVGGCRTAQRRAVVAVQTVKPYPALCVCIVCRVEYRVRYFVVEEGHDGHIVTRHIEYDVVVQTVAALELDIGHIGIRRRGGVGLRRVTARVNALRQGQTTLIPFPFVQEEVGCVFFHHLFHRRIFFDGVQIVKDGLSAKVPVKGNIPFPVRFCKALVQVVVHHRFTRGQIVNDHAQIHIRAVFNPPDDCTVLMVRFS